MENAVSLLYLRHNPLSFFIFKICGLIAIPNVESVRV